MKRRTFLQQAGVLLTGATAVSAANREGPAEQAAMTNGRRPTVLLTALASRFSAPLAKALGEQFEIRPAGGPLFRDEKGTLERMLDGVQGIVHGAQPAGTPCGDDLLDWRGRGTYDLLTVAAAQGVELIVYLSSLQIMAGYDPSYQVTEDWRPVPTADADQLSHYLAECTCREFARERKLRAVVLRLADVVHDESQRAGTFEPPWVDQADAVQAVSLALGVHFGPESEGLPAWSVLHIAADVPSGRFPVTRAKRVLGYRPQFNPPA